MQRMKVIVDGIDQQPQSNTYTLLCVSSTAGIELGSTYLVFSTATVSVEFWLNIFDLHVAELSSNTPRKYYI